MLQLVALERRYEAQLVEMMEEWSATGERIIPSALTRADYHDYDAFIASLTTQDPKFVPASVFFCLDTARNSFVGAVDIRHYLNEMLLHSGGHIGDGVRPSRRREGIATAMIALALEECKKLGIERVLMTCEESNIGSAKSIQKNGGVLENTVEHEGKQMQRYWIAL